MRFHLNLEHISGDLEIPFNYQYLFAAAIYNILAKADREYAAFLHNTGYPIANKSFKLFTFSDLRLSFKPNGDRMRLTGRNTSIFVSFYLPQAAETFIRGLFLDQQISLFDQRSKTIFRINQVETVASPFLGQGSKAVNECIFSLLSPVVISRKNERGNHDYLSPMDADFLPILLGNWKSKYAAVYGGQTNTVFKDCNAAVLFNNGLPKSRLVKIRANSKTETKVRGFYNFQLKLTGAMEALELVYNVGAGSYNSMGMGCLERSFHHKIK